MSEQTFDRTSRAASRLRFGNNIRRLLIEREKKPADLGRFVQPDNKNPSGMTHAWVAGSIPPADTQAKIAQFLMVQPEALHAGDLAPFMKAAAAKAAAPKPPRKQKSSNGRPKTPKVTIDPAPPARSSEPPTARSYFLLDMLFAQARKYYDASDEGQRLRLLNHLAAFPGSTF